MMFHIIRVSIIRHYLEEASFGIAAEDMGLAFPRKINYFVRSGRVMVKKLRALHSRSIAVEEQRYRGET